MDGVERSSYGRCRRVDRGLPQILTAYQAVSVTYPFQSSVVSGKPNQPSRLNKHLFTGLAAGVLVGLVIGCCGGVVIGMNADRSDAPPAAVESVPTTAVSSTPPAPTPAPTTESAQAIPLATSLPTEEDLIAMPDIVGQNAAVAADQLRKLGFTEIQYGSQDTNATVVLMPANWTVTKQSAAPGAKISADTLIVLTCTKSS